MPRLMQVGRAVAPKGLKSVYRHVYQSTASDKMGFMLHRRFGFDAFGSLAGLLPLSHICFDTVSQQLTRTVSDMDSTDGLRD